MTPEDALKDALASAFQAYNLPDTKAESLIRKTVERARRLKHDGPLRRPGVLISDKRAAGRGITLTIRKEKLEKYDPHQVLHEYLEQNNIAGEWQLKEAYGHVNHRVRVWQAKESRTSSPSTVSKKAKKAEESVMQDFNKLSKEEQQKLLTKLK